MNLTSVDINAPVNGAVSLLVGWVISVYKGLVVFVNKLRVT